MQLFEFFVGFPDGIFICHVMIFHLYPRHHIDKYLLESFVMKYHPPIQNAHHDICS
jgi:hypothetical protein